MTFKQAEFKRQLRLNPDLSSFIIFGRMISGLQMPKFYVGKWFLKCVDKRDYDEADIEELITHFVRLTKGPKLVLTQPT